MAANILQPIECSAQPLDISFHPSQDIVAAALVDGTVEFHDFSRRFTPQTSKLPLAQNSVKADLNGDDEEGDDTILSSIEIHCNDLKSESLASSCRSVLFSADGKFLYTAGNGGSLACLDVEKASDAQTSDSALLWKIDNASPDGINALHQIIDSSPAGPLLVTGDDEGLVRLWDIDLCAGEESVKKTAFDGLLNLPKGCVASFHEQKDYITGFTTDESGHLLLSSSADGTLAVIDLKKKSENIKKANHEQSKPTIKSGSFHHIRQSDEQEDELLSLCVLKGGKKVICGTQDGVLAVWSFGIWGDISDRFPGHPQSIDAILKVDEDTILTGSGDGVVRIVQIHPDRLLGVLGNHDGFPVEKLKFSAGRKSVGSVSHDDNIRLWDASIFNDEVDDDDVNMNEDIDEPSTHIASSAARKSCESDDEWTDDDDSMDEDSDSDSDDNAKGKPENKFKTENEQFFEDL